MSKPPRLILAISSILLLGVTALRAARSWSNDSHLEHVSGAWTALAVDLKDGIFYRAPFGPHGYGGTRFFPLFFCLHAAAMKLFGEWRLTGYTLSAVSIVLLIAAVYVLLCRLGANRWLAAGGSLVVLAGYSTQSALLTIREDGMATMLNVSGVALCARSEPSNRRLCAAAALFTLAFATKETTVFGLMAVFLSFLLTRRTKTALRLLALTVAGYTAVLAVIFFASNGRAFEVFRLTAVAGISIHRIVHGPIDLVNYLSSYLGEAMLLAFGAATCLATPLPKLVRIPPLLFLLTAAATCLIFSSEGTTGNHLIDLHVAAAVMLVSWVTSDDARLDLGVGALAAVCMIAWFGLLLQYREVDSVPVRTQVQEVVRTIGTTDAPILAENPLVPIVAGQQPYLMDAFMFRTIREKDSSFADSLWQMLHEKRFSAVVLIKDPDTAEGQAWYSTVHFGKGFVERLELDYQRVGMSGRQYLYMPRGSKKGEAARTGEPGSDR
jgi:hypothetical protein